MFGIGGFELFLILLFGFLVFGPDKLPALAKTAVSYTHLTLPTIVGV